jgi:hypothetical protein
MDQIQPAKEIVQEIWNDFTAAVNQLKKMPIQKEV